jgi:PAS domain S-box-containing protein
VGPGYELKGLVQTTEAFRQVIEYAPTAMIMIDAQGVIELVNGQTEQVFGYSRQELVGRTIDLLLPERFRGLHMKHRDAYLAAPTRRAMGKGQDVFGLRKGGCEFPIEIGLSPLQTPNGVRVISTIVDISYRRDIERAQSESEEQVARMLSSIQDHAIVMLDTAGCVVSWNAGAERLIGYTKEQIIGQHFSLFHLPDAIAAQRPERELIAAAAEGRVEDESWRRRGDGSRFIANVVINAVRAPNGDLCGFVKVTRDITQRKRMEDVLLQANELFAVAAAAAGLGFWEYDIATQSTRWDAQMFKMFHLPPEPSDRFAARRHHVHPDDRSRIEEEVRDAAEGRAKLDTEYRVVLGDGQIRHMKSVASIKRDSIAAGARLLGVTFDITERKEIEGSSLK